MAIDVVTAAFRNREKAEQAFYMLHARGHSDGEIDVLMSDKTRTVHYPPDRNEMPEEQPSPGDAIAMRTVPGRTVGGALGVIASRGAMLPVSDLQIIVAGPIAAALSDDHAATDGFISAFVKKGTLAAYVAACRDVFREGGIGIGVTTRDSEDVNSIKAVFEKLEGEIIFVGSEGTL